MVPFRLLGVGVLALAALTAPRTAADEPAVSTDPVGEAIAKIKASTAATMPTDLEDARAFLIVQWQQSLPQVLVLLDDNNVQIRMDAAVILSGMAQAGDNSPALIEGLQRCVKDSVAGVAYQGFEGLMADAMPAEVKPEALLQIINAARPRSLRLAAIPTILDKKPKPAVPIIIDLLQNILKEYKSQVQAELTPQAAPTRPLVGTMNPRAGTYGAPMLMNPAGRGDLRSQMMRGGPGARGMMFMGGGQMGHGMYGQPGAGMYGQPSAGMYGQEMMLPQQRAAPQVMPGMHQQVTRQELASLPASQVQAWIPVMENLAAVKEVHLMGWTLEELIRTSPDEKLFGFDSTAPWNLDQCVEKAVAWLHEHKAEYETATPAPKPETAAPAVPPAPQAAPAPAKPAP